jgi:hypothetical protein
MERDMKMIAILVAAVGLIATSVFAAKAENDIKIGNRSQFIQSGDPANRSAKAKSTNKPTSRITGRPQTLQFKIRH